MASKVVNIVFPSTGKTIAMGCVIGACFLLGMVGN
jgi:hypothetical protein